MQRETTEWEAIIKAWNVYVHERLGVFTLPNVPPNVSDYFRAGFAAGVAHARTTADPARLARLESLLREMRQWGEGRSALGLDWREDTVGFLDRIAALLGSADAS